MKIPGADSNQAWDEGRSKAGPHSKHPQRRNNPLSGLDIDEAERKRIEGEDPPPPTSPKPKLKSTPTARRERPSLLIIFLLIALACLVLGITGLIVVNKFFPDWPHVRKARVEQPAVVSKPLPPPVRPSPPPPVRQATSPVAAVRLMLSASLAGDRPTAYAQWDIQPDDVVTVERGVPITLAEQTDEAASIGSRAQPGQYDYRLISQSGSEAKVGQYKDSVLTQVYSLRKRGAYWKLYNAAAP